MTLDEARSRTGDAVTYRAPGVTDYGVITSVNNRFVFVRYGADKHSKATSPTALAFDTEGS